MRLLLTFNRLRIKTRRCLCVILLLHNLQREVLSHFLTCLLVCFLCVQVGDEVAISTTSYNAWETEKRQIAAVSADGRVLTLNQPLNHTHIGQFSLCL